MTGPVSPPSVPSVDDRLSWLASMALPFMAILPLEYRAPIETALMVLFPNAG